MIQGLSISALVLLLLAAAGAAVAAVWRRPPSLRWFFIRCSLSFALRHPMLLSELRVLERWGLRFHNRRLDDASVESRQAEAERLERDLGVLRRYDAAPMEAPVRLSRDVLEWFLAEQAEGARFLLHDYPLNQIDGVHLELPNFLLNIHHLGDRRDVEDYVHRAAGFARTFDQILDGLALREARGILPPRFVLQRVLRDLRETLRVPPEESMLWTHLAHRTEKMEGLGGETRDGLLRDLHRVLETSVYPAYVRLLETTARLETKAGDEDGVWRLPDGAACYAHRLRSQTTTHLQAEEIHALGLEELGRIQEEMRAILRAEGLESRDLAAAVRALHEDPRFRYEDSDAGRERILGDYRTILEEIETGLDEIFGLRPRIGVEVRPVPAFLQATAPGAYYQPPPLDRSRPGTFYANLRDVREIPRFGMRTLAYHEGIPGHHFQIAIAQEIDDLPLFRKVLGFTAFAEGWALYAERVAVEAGFQEDPYDRLGFLISDAFRSARLVVDTGIHAKRWTRRQAIDFLLEATGMPAGDVTAEVERYIVWPGQACAYKVGELKIRELRERARARLGPRFDLRAFHDFVLRGGALPLALLEGEVNRWIGEAAAGRGGALLRAAR